MTTPPDQPEDAAQLRQQVFGGKTLQENLRDIVARNNTGYSYAELKAAIAEEEDLLDDDEIESVDKTVNILSHLFHAQQAKAVQEARENQVMQDFLGVQMYLNDDYDESILIDWREETLETLRQAAQPPAADTTKQGEGE